jgi:hypothetical protein
MVMLPIRRWPEQLLLICSAISGSERLRLRDQVAGAAEQNER